MSWPMVKLGELVKVTKGKKPAEIIEEKQPDFRRLLQIEDLRHEGSIKFCPPDIKETEALESDVLLAWDGANAGTSSWGLEGVLGSTLARLRPVSPEAVFTPYLGHFVKAQRGFLRDKCKGATVPHIDGAVLSSMILALPPLEEQRRIAAILDQADFIRAKRQQVVERLSSVSEVYFKQLMEEAGSVEQHVKLSDVALVSSGITKGRKTSEALRSVPYLVPYLAVANVQAGHLALDNIKSIEATETEIERFKLKRGDLVLTEGGDPDKLGRGTVWRGEIEECIHQNHIFRVRVNPDSGIEPELLSAYIASWAARSYFLKSAKQTTGIASINMTQLKALPVLVPTESAQQKYLSFAESIRKNLTLAQHALAESEALFASLQSRAFRGEL